MDQFNRSGHEASQPEQHIPDVARRRLLIHRTIAFEQSLQNLRFSDARHQILFDCIVSHGTQAVLQRYLEPPQPSPIYESSVKREPSVEPDPALKREPSVEGEPVVKSEPRGSIHEPGQLQCHPQLRMPPPNKPSITRGRMDNPVLFVCDIQEAFRPVIHEYPKVISTTQKMIKASSILHIPIYATTQSAARLGPLCAELFLPPATPSFQIDKTAFSMIVPELRARMASDSSQPYQVAITGIEAHICVSQTTLDLLADGHSVYVLADGVSSSHRAQAKIALDRLAKAGAVITTSEAWLYELMGDANHDRFREIKDLVKDSKASTNEALDALCML